MKAALVLVLAAGLAAGCTTAGGPPPGPAKSFSGNGVAFRYPRTWRSGSYADDVSSFSGLIVYLSTGALQDPCLAGSCGDPVSTLAPGGVLVKWTINGFPGRRFPPANRKVGGRPATETTTAASWCTALGGSQAVTVIIPSDVESDWYEMDACLRAPAIASGQAGITAMLASVRFTRGS